jgi:hypothetical protein
VIPLLLTLASAAGAALLVAYVLAPLRRSEYVGPWAEDVAGEYVEENAWKGTPDAPRRAAPEVAALLEQKEAAVAALAELDFDHRLGNLSDSDYQDLRARYRSQAVEAFQALDVAGAQVTQGADAAKGARGVRTARRVGVAPGPAGQAGRERHTPPASPQQAEGSRVALWIMGGAVAAALVGTVAGTALLRGGAPTAVDAADVPALNVLHVHSVLLAPSTTTALVGHHDGLLRSADGGRTWSPVAGVEGEVVSIAAEPVPGGALYLATESALMVSRDGGVTWTAALAPPMRDAANALQAIALGSSRGSADTGGNSTYLYASVGGEGIYRAANASDGSGRAVLNWELTGNLPGEVAGLVEGPGPLAPLYAAIPGEGVLASGDEGQSWGSASGVLNGVLPTLAVRSIAYDPQSGDRTTTADGMQLSGALYAATDLGLYKSIDGGSSWSELPLRLPLAAVASRSGPGTPAGTDAQPLMLAVDSRARIWRSTDRGASWSAKP